MALRFFISAFPSYSGPYSCWGIEGGVGWPQAGSPFSTSLPPLCIAGPTAKERMASPKSCQSPFSDVLCHLYFLPRQGLLATGGQFLSSYTGKPYVGKHPDFCGIPVSVKVERGSPVGSADFLLHLTPPHLLSPSPPCKQVGREERWPERPTSGEGIHWEGFTCRGSGRRRKWPG